VPTLVVLAHRIDQQTRRMEVREDRAALKGNGCDQVDATVFGMTADAKSVCFGRSGIHASSFTIPPLRVIISP
jgi:hypothetical protein